MGTSELDIEGTTNLFHLESGLRYYKVEMLTSQSSIYDLNANIFLVCFCS